jgi:DNA-binding transcriptional regulator YiaG
MTEREKLCHLCGDTVNAGEPATLRPDQIFVHRHCLPPPTPPLSAVEIEAIRRGESVRSPEFQAAMEAAYEHMKDGLHYLADR